MNYLVSWKKMHGSVHNVIDSIPRKKLRLGAKNRNEKVFGLYETRC